MSPASARRSTIPPRRRDEAKALFRNAILEAAEVVFSEHGFHRARIQDVAARARIAVGTVYNHFEDKDEVLRALMAERLEEMLGQFEAIEGDPTDFEEKLLVRIERMLRYVEAHRAFFILAAEQGLFGASGGSASALGGKAGKNLVRAKAAFAQLVQDGMSAGVLETEEVARVARVLGGILRSVILGALQDGTESLTGEAPFVTKIFLNGAAKPGARASKRTSR